MNLINLKDKKFLIALPALAALFIALIPTLKYQWPLGWDIIYHIQYAQVYTNYGFTLTDPLLQFPVGKKIGYPPLFHFLIAVLGSGLGIDYFQISRFLQPILAMLVVLSVSYVGYKFYGPIAGCGAGFLMLSSYLVSRIILPLPENLALIFLPLAVYLYYKSLINSKIKFAFYSGLLFIAVVLTHQAATLCLFLVIVSVTIMELVVYRNLGVWKSITSFFIPLVSLLITIIIFIQIWAPEILQNIIQHGIFSVTGLSTSINNRPLGIFSYLGNLGILVLIFAIIGLINSLKNHQKKDLVILLWTISMLILSYAYLFGINVISYRVLIYILIPLSILGGSGFYFVYLKIKDKEILSSKKIQTCFLVLIIGLSLLNGFLTVASPKIAIFGVKNEINTVQIAPPSNSEVDLANWLNENGNKSRSFVISNQFTGTFLVTKTNIPLHFGFEYYSTNEKVPIQGKFVNNSPLTAFRDENIGYIIYDKRLIIIPPENYLSMRIIDSEFYPLYYFTQDIATNINEIKPDFSRVVYENQDFIVCEVDFK
ncbi:MAG: hypothetical protein HVN35_08510 [Methanobacteriaceae archaeon]|nr:hypothetical protein [Methanobacteriaceae archaeon]